MTKLELELKLTRLSKTAPQPQLSEQPNYYSEQRRKLLAENKAAAARILNGALAQLRANSATTTLVTSTQIITSK